MQQLIGAFRSSPVVLGIALLTVAITARSTVAQGGQTGTPAPSLLTAEEEAAFAEKAEALTYKVCDDCHAFDEVSSPRRTVKDWKNSVTAMAAKGAVATKDQFAVITQYLTRYYGVVNVNTAPAEDLSAVLGLSLKTAQAIVEHRKAGRIADLDALAKVTGVDKAKLEEQPDALRFD